MRARSVAMLYACFLPWDWSGQRTKSKEATDPQLCPPLCLNPSDFMGNMEESLRNTQFAKSQTLWHVWKAMKFI